MMNSVKIHHTAIICGNYEVSKKFYTEVLGLTIIAENYRPERDSYKLDLALNGDYVIELFSFPDAPTRPTRPEAIGLRHLAFQVPDIEATLQWLDEKGITYEPLRVDEFTGCHFTFIADPDDLPIEFYEVKP
nr:VOC family protein [uncultured Flavobacterium sp.]